MTRTLPIVFKQTEFLQLLGNSTTNTIAGYGCYLTSFTNLAFLAGKPVTPPQLNEIFKQKQLFAQGDLISSDADLTKVYPDIIYQESITYPTIYNPDGSVNEAASLPADLQKLAQLVSDPTIWVFLELQLHGGGTHFVLTAGVNGTVMVADPMTGSVIDFASRYGSPALNIIKFVIYKATPATVDSSALQGLQSQLDQAKQLEDSRQEQITTLQAQLQQASNQSQANTQGLSDQNSQLNQKLAEVQKENNDYQTTITELKTELADLTGENSSLADMVRKEADKNSTSIKEGVKASSTLKDLTNYIQGFISYFKIKGMNEKQFIEYLCDEVIKLEKLRKTTETLQVQKDVRADSPTVSMAIKAEEIKKKVPLWLTGLQVLGIVER